MAKKILFETELTEVTPTDIESVGVLRYEVSGNVYRWVKVTATTALTAKQPVCYEVALVGSSAIFESVLTPATVDLMMAAGLAVTAIGASGANMYGWVLAQGRMDAVPVLATSGTAIAVGDELIGVDGETYLDLSVAAGTAPAYIQSYKALGTVSGSTGAELTVDVYANCL